MGQNRRRSERLPVGFYVEQLVDDDPHRCFTTDLSALGIYLERVAEPLQRSSGVVQLEIPLPDTSDTLWAKGEIIYDRFDAIFHGSAIRFAGMARAHQRLLRDWLSETRRERRLLSREQWLLRGGETGLPSPEPVLTRAESRPSGREAWLGSGEPRSLAAARAIRIRRPQPRAAQMSEALSAIPSLPATLPARNELQRRSAVDC